MGTPYQGQTNNVCASLISIFSRYSQVAYAFNNMFIYNRRYIYMM